MTARRLPHRVIVLDWAALLVRSGTLRRIRGWRAYDFQRTGRKPWSDIYVRTDRKVIVASRRR